MCALLVRLIMASLSAKDQVLFGSSGIIVTATLAGIFRWANSNRLGSKAWETVKAIAGSIHAWRHAANDDEVGLAVVGKIQNQMLNDFRRTCHILCVIALPLSIKLMVDAATGQVRQTSLAQDVILLLYQGIVGATFLCPSLLRWQTIDVFHGAIMLVGSVYGLPGIRKEDDVLASHLDHLLVTQIIIFFLSVSRRDVRVVLPLNLLFGVAVCVTIVSDREMHIHRPMFVMLILWASVIAITIFAHMLDMNCRAMTCQGVEMKVTKQVLAASSALLRSCCDVVVELNNEGVILNEGMDLGSFLLRGPNRSLQGYRLTDLMSHEQDKHLFMESLRSQEDSDMAQTIHVRMKDGNDSLLRLQLMWFQFTHVDDKPHYMVGIRNFPSASNQNCQEREETASGHPLRAGSSEMSVTEPESQDTVSNTSELWLPLLVVNATEVGCPILGYSMGFGSRIGRVPLRTQLAELVKLKDCFNDWLANALNQAAYGEPHDPIRLTLCMPHGRIKATCKILVGRSGAKAAGLVEMHKEVEEEDEELEDEEEQYESEEQQHNIDPKKLCLVFSDMKNKDDSQPRAPTRLKGTPGSTTVAL